MFEHAIQQKDSNAVWGVIAGVVAFAVLLVSGYFLIAPTA